MAKQHGTDLKPTTPEQHAILTGETALPVAKANPSFALMQKLASNKTTKRRALTATSKALEIELIPGPRLIREQQFWAKLGVAVVIDDLMIPELPTDFTEVAIIPDTLTCEQLFALCAKHFLSWKYDYDLNKSTRKQVRPKGTYVVGYRGGIEPDLEHRGKGYGVATKEGLIFMNPKERLVAELRYAVPNGVYLSRHLDVKGGTVTSSLTLGAISFLARWNTLNSTFIVNASVQSYTLPDCGHRQVVCA
ncbi:MAG: hypothetical protein A3C93_03150 [Candidatus Lloydbacteria bacterium RIFCSPHIGHO2_02_FULL_54_17]|uniref:Uncharacterized protein n=1 Tax=Candidatus Lloydbacteria bacterium RIFCSPHIGHO2_02_FULL_54_17 TaxID=1798664 RepID=A0A1G2DEL0_9BACT|nr:MAG: hypothetical protein A2762_04170 [Candidatus Lloydbacteria bacterium RIFCSPHIGHO2_01_FULL_54_11]OGZ12074.1 MAG: hypothetical protein A3C93_03150 [Candidatus Lloydbacteria bacterium RIFCSPHIGHO2_02_FULL_54_17]OGZ13393.1 MAG: hypothetical protein A2948_01395 [Candidatus Lloydbacteria bacterium RIFCSPLOWO2_01_FULL_54_18]OGZ15756.1 MAG: hypothetical protein A3H76_06480 [Candidatus Lloydbacteria bacterium RIFCSPLOWO2_02_FULL_54_12]